MGRASSPDLGTEPVENYDAERLTLSAGLP
jgi:hypothetical protein